ncbi:MAG: helix-turn-helix transcriptional regulator [Cyanobacteria bacterium P01_A01_bin.123]
MPTVQVKRVVEETRDFPGLGAAIKRARELDERSLSQICREADISRAYWYQLENEDLRSPATEDVIRKIEKALSVKLGVEFDNQPLSEDGEDIKG